MKALNYFSRFEKILYFTAVFLILASFLVLKNKNYLSLSASILGVTSLIFNAKGNPTGQFLMVIFSVLYGIISFSFSYYGEMITYLLMTAPMAVFALYEWLTNPYENGKAQVRVNRISKNETVFMIVMSLIVTLVFFFILKAFNTNNLALSTVSVTTSFVAVYLTARRSPYFALAYALNDIILIILWILASTVDISYISVIICFVMFLILDLYGLISWIKMEKRQRLGM